MGKVRKDIIKVWMFEGRYRKYYVNGSIWKSQEVLFIDDTDNGALVSSVIFGGFLQFHLEKLQVIQQFHLPDVLLQK